MTKQLTTLAFGAFMIFSVQNSSAQRYLEMIELGTYSLSEIQTEANQYFEEIGTGRGTGYTPYKRWEYMASLELDGDGIKIPNEQLSRQARENRRVAKSNSRQKGDQVLSANGDWKELGPTYKNGTSGWNPGVGRVTSIGIDPSNSSHIIVGGPTGGVWKTSNAGSTWLPLSDDFSTMDVYALAISPHSSSTYFWGSTSGKIYKSTDAGASWAASGSAGSGNVSKFLIHPTNANLIFAVNESSGLYKSTNGGATWSAIKTGYRGYDVEFKPGNTNVVYFSGTRVFKSTDGGSSFSELSGFGTATNNYKMMGVSDANAELLCVVEADGGVFGGFYKSTNSGASFSKLHDGTVNYFGYDANGGDDKGQAPRDMDITISPSDANEIHIAGIQTWKSMDGGSTFDLSSYWTPGGASSRGVGYCHADVDILLYVGSTLYVGSDGGIYISTNKGASYTDISVGLGIRQFYKIGVSKTDANVVSGGAQDNGTSVMYGVGRDWRCWLGADGMETFVDWNNPSRLFGTSQNGSFYRSTNQGVSYSGLGKPSSGSGAWVTPFEQDPSVANTVYCGYHDVWKSTDAGSNWTQLSNFGTASTMSNLKIAPSSNQYIYATRGSTLYVSTNGGVTWNTYSSAAGGSTIKYISIHPSNAQRVLAVTSSSIYESTNAGATFSNITNNLPSGTKYCGVYEEVGGKTGIYIGGYGTLYYTNSDLGTWVDYMDGIPNVRIYELEINYVSNTIFAGTYGRGLWESDLYSAVSLNAPVAGFQADQLSGCQSLTVQFTDTSSNSPTAWNWTFSGGSPSSSTQQNPQVTFSSGGVHDVVLEVTNADGSDSETKVGYITVSAPTAPSIDTVMNCGAGQIKVGIMTTGGQTAKWYDQASGGALLETGDTLAAVVSSNTAFYCTISENGCEGTAGLAYVSILDPGTANGSDQSICAPGGQIQLSASGSNGGTILWYASATVDTTLASGTTYSPTVTSTTTFYVSSAVDNFEAYVGAADTSIGTGGSHAGGYYLIFDAEEDIVVKSAEVYAFGTKDRTFELRNSSGTVVESKVVSVPDGLSRIILDFSVPKGSDWQIGAASGADLFRNNGGVTYPYTEAGLVSITSSTAGGAYYYYLYDIKIQAQDLCESSRVPIQAVVEVCTGVNEKEVVSVTVYPNPATDQVTLNGANGANCEISDATGKIISTIKVISDAMPIDISEYACGAYSFRIYGNKQTESTILVSKQ